jgi:hypothetical protein
MKSLWGAVWETLGYLAVLVTLLGVSIRNILDDNTTAWIALTVFIVALAFSCYRFYYVTRCMITRRYPEGFLPLSSFVRYVCSDGKHISYEAFRHIQIKQPYMSSFKHKFSWSGTQRPKCESDLQEIGKTEEIPGVTTKSLELKFKKPRIYNDVEIVHVKMQIDDSDQKSGTFISQTVHMPIKLICFRVELLSADAKYNGKYASLRRKFIPNGKSALEEEVQTIPFDPHTKAFFCQVTDPEPGYDYTLSWERP